MELDNNNKNTVDGVPCMHDCTVVRPPHPCPSVPTPAPKNYHSSNAAAVRSVTFDGH